MFGLGEDIEFFGSLHDDECEILISKRCRSFAPRKATKLRIFYNYLIIATSVKFPSASCMGRAGLGDVLYCWVEVVRVGGWDCGFD